MTTDLGGPTNPLNVVSLREYVDRIVDNQKDAVDAALKAHDLRHEANDAAVGGRLEKLNELRSEVIQDRSEYMRRDVFDTQITGLAKQIADLNDFRSRALGFGALIALLSGAVGAVIGRFLG